MRLVVNQDSHFFFLQHFALDLCIIFCICAFFFLRIITILTPKPFANCFNLFRKYFNSTGISSVLFFVKKFLLETTDLLQRLPSWISILQCPGESLCLLLCWISCFLDFGSFQVMVCCLFGLSTSVSRFLRKGARNCSCIYSTRTWHRILN